MGLEQFKQRRTRERTSGEQTFREFGTDRVPFLQSTARWIVADEPLISVCGADETILSAYRNRGHSRGHSEPDETEATEVSVGGADVDAPESHRGVS